MDERVVVTGVGALSPFGHDLAAIAGNLECGPRQTSFGVQHRLNGHSVLWSVAGLDDTRFVSGRLRRKLDPFCINGIVAAAMALESSGLDPEAVDPAQVGIYVGNTLGGWTFTEPRVAALHTGGVTGMGPYVATAWFPAAVQGQISLLFGFKGHSKTFSTRDVAGLQAIGHAAAAIRRGRVRAVICGAAEDLSSAYVRTVLGGLTGAHRPASLWPGRFRNPVFADGAAFLVLESAGCALARNATPLAEVSGFADQFCPSPDRAPEALASAHRRALGGVGSTPLLVLDGVNECEEELVRAGCRSRPATTVDPRPALGQQFAVTGVLEAALVARALHEGSLRAGSLGGLSGGPGHRSALVQRLSSQGQVTALCLTANDDRERR
jgi:3-oxoacyl-[acyl-carrier-protein] synthase II